MAAHAPFADAATAHAVYVGFLADPPDAAAAARLLALRTPDDEFHVEGRELYWLRRRGMADSKLSNTSLERALGAATTLRSTTTVGKLAAKYGDTAAPRRP